MEDFAQRLWAEERGNVVLDWCILFTGVILLSAAVFGATTFEAPPQIADGPAPIADHADT